MLFLKTNWRWIAGALAVIAIIALVAKIYGKGEEAGADKIENETLKQTIQNVEKANEVRQTFPADNRRRYDQCLRTARSPENCERWLPRVPADDRPTSP